MSFLDYLTTARTQIHHHFTQELIPFWLQNSIDHEHGGYLTSFDGAGNRVMNNSDKSLIMQVRMLWSFAYFCHFLGGDANLQAATTQGVDFLIANLWDDRHGGWFSRVTRDGQQVTLPYKVVYEQSFAIYGLAEYFLATGDARGLEYANRTFDLLQLHALDMQHGGYQENFTRDWHPLTGEHFSAEWKTLNTHMHLMEAYTTLYRASGAVVHARRLQDLIDLILAKMINPATGAGYDVRLDRAFVPQPVGRHDLPTAAGADQPAVHEFEEPVLLNSFGHDVELAWLLRPAAEALGQPVVTYLPAMRRLVDFTLAHGIDYKYGGLYLNGTPTGDITGTLKGWWQQAEMLVACLDLYELTGETRYLDAFQNVWEFINTHLINHAAGEWHTTLTRMGGTYLPALGHEWKSAYHTGRAMGEVLHRLDRILGENEAG